jgi:hypothetical protein
VCAKVKEVTGQEIELWATVFSPGYGTISWTGWFSDLAALETVSDKLESDPSYLELSDAGATFIEGGVDDGLLSPIAGEPDGAVVQYVAGTAAVVAAGSSERALAAGVEIAYKAESITGVPTMFVRSATGPYGGVGWLTGYQDAAAMQRAEDALAADPGWSKLIDSTKGCFVEDPALTQATIYRRLG